ncbi:hypothetical protein [Nonomuraea typhae]|uniref:hypothetical protein n=1 Tax=Nonomuraea typhae TaxID=2603600 RepID=UPI0012F7D4EC|nr:hypothetical protein [Nonomuraea typhae]
MLTVITATTLLVSFRGSDADRVTTGSSIGASPTIAPAAQVWPQAVAKIPATAPDGWKYRPITGFGPDEILLAAESSFEKTGRLEVFNVKTAKSRILAKMPEPGGVDSYFVQDVAVSPKYIAWWGATPNTNQQWADVWVMPRSGGVPSKVIETSGMTGDIERLEVLEETIVWSVSSGGVYEIGIAGGAPHRILGSEGLHILSWPWATDVPRHSTASSKQTRLVNLVSGQAAPISVLSDAQGIRCTPVWCSFASNSGELNIQPQTAAPRQVLGMIRTRQGMEPLGNDFGLIRGRSGKSQSTSDASQEEEFSAILFHPPSGAVGGVGTESGFSFGASSSLASVIYWDADIKRTQVCSPAAGSTAPQVPAEETGSSTTHESKAEPQRPVPSLDPGARRCGTRFVGGGEELTVLNLAAIR